jgi:hypothetical protein
MLLRLAGLWLVAAACSNATSLAIDAACNPLGDGHCMTPWPSSVYEIDDPSTATGRRLAIPEGALPRNADGVAVDPAGWNAADGFSPAAPIAMAWRGGVSPDDLPPIDNPGLSLADDSPTVILDMTTGARIAHYAELDAQAADRPDAQALLLRPAARLVGGHRYAVAITRRVRAPDGGDLAVPAGFAALRDHRDTDHALLEAMRPRFGEVLAALEAAGVASDALVVAWDFTVASDDFLHRDLTAARDRALAALADHPIGVTVTGDAPIGDGRAIRRRITGTLDAPLLLTQGGAAAPGTRIARDAAGLPAVQGVAPVPFTAIVPACAYTAAAPVAMIVYGHGLFGSAAEVASRESQLAARELCAVIAGTDMRGMSMRDLPAFARALADLGRADEVIEVVAQGIVDHLALVRALRTQLARQLFVDRARGRSLVDPDRVYYYGVAQGSVLGASLLAYEPALTRGVLVAAAANYSTLLERSTDWALYRALLATAYPDPLDVAMAVGLFQMRWDKVEAAGIADRMLDAAPAGAPARQVLLQVALGDDQVANVGSYWLARTMGIPVVGPAPATPWGLAVRPGPLPGGSAMLILDGGAPPPPAANLPPPELGMHQLPRIEPAALRQIRRFYATGEIINPCAGPCVCQTGACE